MWGWWVGTGSAGARGARGCLPDAGDLCLLDFLPACLPGFSACPGIEPPGLGEHTRGGGPHGHCPEVGG